LFKTCYNITYEENIFLIGIVLIGCMIVSITLMMVFGKSRTDLFSDITTLISIISTLGLGVIAIFQTRHYRNENMKQLIIQELKMKRDILYNQFENIITRKTVLEDIDSALSDIYGEEHVFILKRIDPLVVKELNYFRLLKQSMTDNHNFIDNKKELIDAFQNLESDMLKYLFESNKISDLSYGYHRYDDRISILSTNIELYLAGINDLIELYINSPLNKIIESQNKIKQENEALNNYIFELELKKWDGCLKVMIIFSII